MEGPHYRPAQAKRETLSQKPPKPKKGWGHGSKSTEFKLQYCQNKYTLKNEVL
jgi:hypothetical protein